MSIAKSSSGPASNVGSSNVFLDTIDSLPASFLSAPCPSGGGGGCVVVVVIVVADVVVVAVVVIIVQC